MLKGSLPKNTSQPILTRVKYEERISPYEERKKFFPFSIIFFGEGKNLYAIELIVFPAKRTDFSTEFFRLLPKDALGLFVAVERADVEAGCGHLPGVEHAVVNEEMGKIARRVEAASVLEAGADEGHVG